MSDILLQGYMYITRNHVAFYSNVFGYVTKLLIPIASVTRISKKKTVKIFPNAIAVATNDERHVFSSFLSRETAYQLMINIWQNAMPTREIEVLPTSAQLRPHTNIDDSISRSASDQIALSAQQPKVILQVVRQITTQSTDSHGDIDASELEISENDSSSAISGSEGLMKLLKSQAHSKNGDDESNETFNRNMSSSCNSNPSDCDLATKRIGNFRSDILDSDAVTDRPFFNGTQILLTLSSIKFEIPRSIHIAYFGILLAILLALSAAYLNYRIVEIKNSHIRFSIDEYQSVSGFCGNFSKNFFLILLK